MSATPPPVPPSPRTSPTIPLTPEVKAAYQHLAAQYQAAFDANTDLAFRLEVLAWKTDVDNILEKDAMYRFDLDTALFAALLVQIENTNTDLLKIKGEIEAIASRIAMAADVLAAINKVLTLAPAL